MHAYLSDIAGSVLHHHHKASIPIKQVTLIFWNSRKIFWSGNLKKNSGIKRLSLANNNNNNTTMIHWTAHMTNRKRNLEIWKLCLRKSTRMYHRKLKKWKIWKRNLQENEKLQHMIVIWENENTVNKERDNILKVFRSKDINPQTESSWTPQTEKRYNSRTPRKKEQKRNAKAARE